MRPIVKQSLLFWSFLDIWLQIRHNSSKIFIGWICFVGTVVGQLTDTLADKCRKFGDNIVKWVIDGIYSECCYFNNQSAPTTAASCSNTLTSDPYRSASPMTAKLICSRPIIIFFQLFLSLSYNYYELLVAWIHSSKKIRVIKIINK